MTVCSKDDYLRGCERAHQLIARAVLGEGEPFLTNDITDMLAVSILQTALLDHIEAIRHQGAEPWRGSIP